MSPEGRRVLYCLIPQDLGARVHTTLRRHFEHRLDIEVVVERRREERRAGGERRKDADPGAPGQERRRIRNSDGRRIGERRARQAELSGTAWPELPRRLRRFADQIIFVERIEPSTRAEEDLDSARLVTRVQSGDREAFEDLYRRYFSRVHSYLRITLRDAYEAEDVTQQVFLKVYERVSSYERESVPFRAWLFAIVRNSAVDHLRKQGRIDVMDPGELGRRRENGGDVAPEGTALDWITDRDLVLFVERLPLVQRQVLMMRYMLGMSTAEVAQVLGRSEVDVRGLSHRALEFLRARLAAVGREPQDGRRSRMRRWTKPAQVIRRRRFALTK